jgi:hypothetical protein
LDSTCAEAVDAARDALVEVAPPGSIGEHLGVEPEQERVVTHYFAADLPGYRGWRWAATVMRASRSKTVTVAESVLLPGDESLLPPSWVPWTDRLRPGDLGVGDLLPTDEDDPRLEPGWNASDTAAGVVTAETGLFGPDAALTEPAASTTEEPVEVDDHEDGWVDTDAGLAVAIELDLLRPRVLSPIGLDDAVDRWRSGDQGPDAPMAQSAPARCATCGFRVPLRGSLGQAFGLCANEISPSDGRVVSLDHGCGAHSEAVVVPTMAERAEPVIDEVGFESVDREAAADETPDETPDAATPDETPDATTDPTPIELADEPPVLDHDAEPAGEPSDG